MKQWLIAVVAGHPIVANLLSAVLGAALTALGVPQSAVLVVLKLLGLS